MGHQQLYLKMLRLLILHNQLGAYTMEQSGFRTRSLLCRPRLRNWQEKNLWLKKSLKEPMPVELVFNYDSLSPKILRRLKELCRVECQQWSDHVDDFVNLLQINSFNFFTV